MIPTTIDSEILAKIHERIPPTFTQAHRLIDYLAERPQSITVDINQACAIGNISDVAHKMNHYLWEFSLICDCSAYLRQGMAIEMNLQKEKNPAQGRAFKLQLNTQSFSRPKYSIFNRKKRATSLIATPIATP